MQKVCDERLQMKKCNLIFVGLILNKYGVRLGTIKI